jgi:hypothetical protein
MNDAKEQKTDSHIALLAPVPLVHLKSAGDVKERVEFGSLAFGVFDTLEKQRGEHHVDVYIYASLHDGSSLSQYWCATYIGISEHEAQEHRPPTTKCETGWGIFWKVKDLRQASPGEWRIDGMQGFEKGKKYNKFFIPKGPLLIKHP